MLKHCEARLEWIFLRLHKADVRIGGDRNQTLEVIGPASEANEFFMHYYDSKGERGEMTATLNGGIWTFLGNRLRFAGGFKNSDREFSGIWEQSDDGKTWSKFMEIKLLKV